MKDVTMRLYELYFVVALIAFTYSSAIPKQGEGNHKERVIDKTLSNAEHNPDGHHNNEYDHEAFLGRDDAKTFDDLSPEESKERLAIIVDKMDKDKNGEITMNELKEWIKFVQKRYIINDTERMWKDHELEDDKLTWNSYKKRTYGYSEESEIGEDHQTMVKRDDRRWKVADKNNDGFLDKEEYADFLHPEEVEHMQDIVVKETIEDIDKDGDGKISEAEYIEDVYGQDEDDDDTEPDDDGHQDGEPDWVKSEREQFHNHRDKNMDGKLDENEVKEWIIPEEYDHVTAEAEHLLRTSDDDRSDFLTKTEILDHYDVFVGSQATDFGEALLKHDEF